MTPTFGALVVAPTLALNEVLSDFSVLLWQFVARSVILVVSLTIGKGNISSLKVMIMAFGSRPPPTRPCAGPPPTSVRSSGSGRLGPGFCEGPERMLVVPLRYTDTIQIGARDKPHDNETDRKSARTNPGVCLTPPLGDS